MIFFLSFLACDLLNPENLGIYTCDDYCDQVVTKTEECAVAQCEADPESCGGGEFTEEDLAAYAASGREDWEGKSKRDMVGSCNDDLEAAAKSDTECQAETALINNLTCDEMLTLLGDIEEQGG